MSHISFSVKSIVSNWLFISSISSGVRGSYSTVGNSNINSAPNKLVPSVELVVDPEPSKALHDPS